MTFRVFFTPRSFSTPSFRVLLTLASPLVQDPRGPTQVAHAHAFTQQCLTWFGSGEESPNQEEIMKKERCSNSNLTFPKPPQVKEVEEENKKTLKKLENRLFNLQNLPKMLTPSSPQKPTSTFGRDDFCLYASHKCPTTRISNWPNVDFLLEKVKRVYSSLCRTFHHQRYDLP